MRDFFSRFTPDERRAINHLRVRVILFYLLLIVGLVALTSIKAMWGGSGEVMEAQAQDAGVYTTAGQSSRR
jgi:hypothetical protein